MIGRWSCLWLTIKHLKSSNFSKAQGWQLKRAKHAILYSFSFDSHNANFVKLLENKAKISKECEIRLINAIEKALEIQLAINIIASKLLRSKHFWNKFVMPLKFLICLPKRSWDNDDIKWCCGYAGSHLQESINKIVKV